MASQQRTPGELTLPRGVTIRTHSSGKQGIQIAFTYRGKQCRKTLHGRDVNTPNLKYAAGLLARINSEIADGDFDYGRHFPRSPAAHRIADPGSMVTVSELMNDLGVTVAGNRGRHQSRQLTGRTTCETALDVNVVGESLWANLDGSRYDPRLRPWS